MFALLVGAVLASPADRVRKLEEKVNALLRAIDSLEVRALLPPIEGAADSALILDSERARQVVSRLRVSELSFKSEGFEEDGVFIPLPCQCLGEFEFELRHEDRVVLRFSVHHRQHIRSEALTAGEDITLKEEDLEFLYKTAFEALPEYGRRLQTPDKPAQHNAGSRPDSGESPPSETPSAPARVADQRSFGETRDSRRQPSPEKDHHGQVSNFLSK